MACASNVSIVWETEKSNQPSNLMKCSPDRTLQGPGEGCASLAAPARSVLLTICGQEALKKKKKNQPSWSMAVNTEFTRIFEIK